MRSGRLDRKIELPVPTEDARSRIMQIHSRKMNVQYVFFILTTSVCFYFLVRMLILMS